MSTALNIITRAMKKVGILSKTESPTADEAEDALSSLNELLLSWSNDATSIYARTTENFSLVGSTNTYSIGTSQTFNTTRPVNILDAYIRINNIDYQMDVINEDMYNDIGDKSSLGRPILLTYTQSYPYGSIRVWPTPDQAYTIYLVCEKPLTSYALADTVSLPPGWERALIYNLAVELAPEYGMQPDQGIFKIAGESKGLISRTVMKNKSMDVPVSPRNYQRALEGYRY